jgi:hypothetical protein
VEVIETRKEKWGCGERLIKGRNIHIFPGDGQRYSGVQAPPLFTPFMFWSFLSLAGGRSFTLYGKYMTGCLAAILDPTSLG